MAGISRLCILCSTQAEVLISLNFLTWMHNNMKPNWCLWRKMKGYKTNPPGTKGMVFINLCSVHIALELQYCVVLHCIEQIKQFIWNYTGCSLQSFTSNSEERTPSLKERYWRPFAASQYSDSSKYLHVLSEEHIFFK